MRAAAFAHAINNSAPDAPAIARRAGRAGPSKYFFNGVAVTTINPGFVVTAMTEKNRFRMPFLMKADRAAKIIADGLDRGQRIIEFPLPMSLLTRFNRLLPAAIYERLAAPFGKRKMDNSKVRR